MSYLCLCWSGPSLPSPKLFHFSLFLALLYHFDRRTLLGCFSSALSACLCHRFHRAASKSHCPWSSSSCLFIMRPTHFTGGFLFSILFVPDFLRIFWLRILFINRTPFTLLARVGCVALAFFAVYLANVLVWYILCPGKCIYLTFSSFQKWGIFVFDHFFLLLKTSPLWLFFFVGLVMEEY